MLVGDVLKGVIACLIGLYLSDFTDAEGSEESLGILAAGAGAGAVIGHNWPIYFRFKGGKGALTAASVMLMINWQATLIGLGVFVAIVTATRYVSLGTICSVLIFVAISFAPFFENSIYFHIIYFLLASIIVFKHRENIRRLLDRNENILKL